ncbi:response regulator [Bacillus tuaregi]|uniref:response regulator n=1 Tax=Bacillus tuaregi TaxID=1816695 RepID=UPI000AE11176|nr:response regulator [Bacillus tuaregi]
MAKKLLSEFKHFDFVEADNGYKAVEMYKLNAPDIVFMDIVMPKQNGINTLKEIMKLDANAKVIMCSSLGQKHLIIDSLKIGAKDFVVKPHFQNLEFVVNNHI